MLNKDIKVSTEVAIGKLECVLQVRKIRLVDLYENRQNAEPCALMDRLVKSRERMGFGRCGHEMSILAVRCSRTKAVADAASIPTVHAVRI